MVRARSEGPFAVDLDDFPLVLVRSPSAHEYEHIDVASFFACADRAIAKHRHFVLLHDVRGIPYVDEARQSGFLDQLARRRRQISKYVLAYAAVASSPMERGIITALGWTAHLPLPTRIFPAEPEARAFLLARHAGMPLRAGHRSTPAGARAENRSAPSVARADAQRTPKKPSESYSS